MRLVGSSRFLLDPSEKLTLARMARDGHRAKRSEKGEISDDDSSTSLEEISAEDFKQDSRSTATAAAAATRSRVWMGYPMSRNYATDLYNFAWAQAVQNKPLGLDLNPLGAADSAAAKSCAAAGQKSVKEESCDVIIEDSSEETGGGPMEKEEGELEEGEIGFESDAVASERIDLSADSPKEDSKENGESDAKASEEIGEFDRRVSLILEELEAVTVEEAETSFESVCSRLRTSFENLKPMFLETESAVPVVDALVHQAFMGIQTVYSVLSSENLKNKEQNKDLLLRLLIHIKNQYSALLTPEHVKEIDAIVLSLVSENDKEKEPCAVKLGNMNDSNREGRRPDTLSYDLASSGNSSLGAKFVSSDNNNGQMASLRPLEIPTISRSRVEFSPLLDLHADYDECSLPSPTRDNTPALPIPKPIGFGTGASLKTQPVPSIKVGAENATSHPYVTDAFKAVSSYQQKYGQSSLLASNRLPSPTPSEDCNDDDDTHDEVSSSSTAGTSRIVDTLIQSQFALSSSSAYADSSIRQQPAPVKLVGQPGLGPNSVVKPVSKSRDPRLRFVNAEVRGTYNPNVQVLSVDANNTNNGHVGGTLNGGKHKASDEPVPEDHALKRQKNGHAISRDAHMPSGRGGWFEENGVLATQPNDRIQLTKGVEFDIKKASNGGVVTDRRLEACNNLTGSNGGTHQNPSSCNVPVSLPSLLKDIAVNPTMLMQLIQMEQQRLAAEAQQKPAGSAHSSIQVSSVNGLAGAVASANGVSVKSTEVGQSLPGRTQMPVQSAPMSDVGRIRMKPRDPRRVLHNNVVQKGETMGFGQTKTNGTPSSDPPCSKEQLTGQEQEHLQTTSLPSQSSIQHDIAQQFAKNLKHMANIVSTQSTSTSVVVPQNISLPSPSMICKVDPRPSSSQLTATSPAVPQNFCEPIPSVINKVDPRPAEPKPVSGVASEGGGAVVTQSASPWGDVDHLLDGYDDQQKAAFQKERARRIAEQNKMFAARKLCLVLDLDHTLLNSAKFVEVDPAHEEILRKKEEQDREKPQRHLFRFPHMGMWTKLRPGIWNFLEKASHLYELHLYTMGNKLYATEMAKVLDPTGTLFAGRVIARGDDGDPFDSDDRVPKIKDLDGVLGMESAVVIIDDSVRVWPHNKPNLIVVERYTYFPCSRRQFGLLGPSLLEIDHDERPEDGTLASSLAVIERIHQNFFSHRSLNDVDVRSILVDERRKILAGCCILFSRVFPVGEANPHLHPLWHTAEQFGAVCTTQINDQVTHVVANSLGTDKVNWAQSTGRFVVGPGWVEASALLYRRANEHDYVVKQ